MHEMMASSPTDNECSSTSTDITMTTRRTSSVHGETDLSINEHDSNNLVDVTSTSEEVDVDENIVIDMSMGSSVNLISSSSPQPPMNYDDDIQSPESESEELTIDEKFMAEDSLVEVTPMELGDVVDVDESSSKVHVSSASPLSPPQESDHNSDRVDTTDKAFDLIRSPSPVNNNETIDIQSPQREEEDEDGDLQIDENEKVDETEGSKNETVHSHNIIENPTIIPDESSIQELEPEVILEKAESIEAASQPMLVTENVMVIEPEKEEVELMQQGNSNDQETVAEQVVERPCDSEDQMKMDEIMSEEMDLSTVDISSPGQNSSPDSPDASQSGVDIKSPDHDESFDADSKGPQSPEIRNGSFDESQQSLPSPPETPQKNEQLTKKPKAEVDTEDAEEEVDLEDGEIMDEEEEENDDGEVKVKAEPPSPVAVPQKESKSARKRREKEKEKDNKEELDPVKRLLAEVREKDMKDKSEKEKEREKRRKDKKRSKKDEKEKDQPINKKKKRRLSEEEEDGEEFLLVRGASPTGEADGWGDDYARNKRRRESESSTSPPHRHHRRPAEVAMSPPRPRPGLDRPKRPERKEPKSDVICAYFMQGKCQKSADDCNFSHAAVPPRKMELCKFWMMDCCAKKEKCIYLHNDFPCKFYHTGLVCRLADRCKFSHQPLSEVTKQVLLKHIETAPKEILGDFPRLNRAGALNLINKMEAKINGVPYHEDESHKGNDNHMDHGPPPYGHQQHQDNRHGPPHGHDRSRGGDRGHYGQNHHDHGGRGRGQGQDNRGDRGGGGGGVNDRRQSRWEQTQPTRDDQHKLQELMDEAGIAGFYKDTLEGNGSQQMQPNQTPQNQMFPPGMQNMQPPLLPHPMLPQFLPHMLPQQTQGIPQVNNPALASVLATLNIPSSSIVPNNMTQFQPPPLIANPPPTNQSQSQDDQQKQDAPADNSNILPDNLPKMQRDLFLRIQQQQLKNENKVQTQDKSEPEEPEENWYSDDEEEDSKKKEDLKAEINDQISSVLNQIRQQSQQQQPAIPKESEKTFFGDTDLRASTPAGTDFKDVDLRTSNIFKKIDILPATEINASLSSHGPMIYKVLIVAGLRDKPDYNSVRQTLTTSAILMDPRLGPKRSNSIPTPASPTEQSADGGLNQPMNIPDGPPVFDPRTMRGNSGNNQPLGRGMGMDQPPPNMFPDNSVHGMNDFSNPFNRDPRGSQNQVQQSQQSSQNMAGNSAAAQNLALAAAAAAMMQQQWPNQQPPMDPNLFMLGFPFLPPGANNQQQNPGMDFNSLMGAGMRLRPPFNQQQQQQQQQQQPPSSSWERFSQGQGQGDLSPPL